MPIFLTRERLLACSDELGPVREAAGARSKPLTVATGPVVVVDQDAETARRVAGSLIAWYLCAMGDVYRRCVVAQGYAAGVQAIDGALLHISAGLVQLMPVRFNCPTDMVWLSCVLAAPAFWLKKTYWGRR